MYYQIKKLSHIVAVSVLINCAYDSYADWSQFRGVNSSGVAVGKLPPAKFSPSENKRWELSVGAGHSSPCIVGDAIYLTSYNKDEKQLSLLSIHRITGQLNWRRAIEVDKIETGHPSFNPASSTPACDGERVVAYFGSFGLICFDIKGEKLWGHPLPLTKSYSGNATSPIITGNSVILYRANYVDHFLLSLDKRTGKENWKKYQEERFTTPMAAAATPIVSGNKVFIHSVRSVQAYNIEDGKRVWRVNCSTTATSTPVLAKDKIVVATWNQTGEPDLVPVFPPYEELLKNHDKDSDKLINPKELPRLMYFHRSEGAEAPENGAPLRFGHVDSNRNGKIDAPEWNRLLEKINASRKKHIPHGLIAIDITSQGQIDLKNVTYLERNSIPEVPSPIFSEGKIYIVKNGGILSCFELSSGKRLYRIRTKGKGTHYASPVIIKNYLYSTSGVGQISVIKLGNQPEIIAINDLGENVYATPAIVDGVIYVRTHSKLYAFGPN